MTRFLSVRAFVLTLVAAGALSACDAALDPADPAGPSGAADLTEAELTEATEIVAEALAEDGGGLMASARDLTASVSADGMADDGALVRGAERDQRTPCRGDYTMTYDAATGTHLVGYRCGFQSPTVQRGASARLAYRYRDADGGFIPRPWRTWDTVDSVAFQGARQGFVRHLRGDSLGRQSTYEQTATWTLSQLADNTTPALLAGRQTRTGTHARRSPDGMASRTFTVQLSARRIQIRENEAGLTFAARGEVAYVLTMEVMRNGQTRTRTVEGTLQLDGNGRALLRVFGLARVYRVSLADGTAEIAV